jgi:hypothetical protein
MWRTVLGLLVSNAPVKGSVERSVEGTGGGGGDGVGAALAAMALTSGRDTLRRLVAMALQRLATFTASSWTTVGLVAADDEVR